MRPALEAMRKAAVPEGPPAVEVLRAHLARMGIEPEPAESSAETTARAMGISCLELRRQLIMRAASLSRRSAPDTSLCVYQATTRKEMGYSHTLNVDKHGGFAPGLAARQQPERGRRETTCGLRLGIENTGIVCG